MKQRKINWVFLSIVVIIALIAGAHSLLPPPKVRAQKIQGVNNLTRLSITITNSGVLPGPAK